MGSFGKEQGSKGEAGLGLGLGTEPGAPGRETLLVSGQVGRPLLLHHFLESILKGWKLEGHRFTQPIPFPSTFGEKWVAAPGKIRAWGSPGRGLLQEAQSHLGRLAVPPWLCARGHTASTSSSFPSSHTGDEGLRVLAKV